MNKRVLVFIIFMFLLSARIVFSLRLDYNTSAITPKMLSPNTTATAILCLDNDEYPATVESLYIDLNSSNACIKLDKKNVYINSVYTSTCFPITIKSGDCTSGLYWITLYERYYVNGNLRTNVEYFTFEVFNPPRLIFDYNVSNNFLGETANLSLHIENFGSEAKNVMIFSNYSNCNIYPKEVYIDHINKSLTLNLHVNIPSSLYGKCIIPLIITYKDSFGNEYHRLETITFPVYFLSGRLILKSSNLTIRPGGYGKVTFDIENQGSVSFYNVIIKTGSIPGLTFNDQEFYIGDLKPGEVRKVITYLHANVNLEGTYSIPVYLFYTDKYGKVYNDTFFITVNVNEKPRVNISIRKHSEKEFDVVIYNLGNVKINGVYIKVSCKGCILPEKTDDFINEIDANDYDTASFEILPEAKNVTLTISVEYKDPLGNKYVSTFVRKLSFEGARQNNSILYILIAIILLIIILVAYRKIKK